MLTFPREGGEVVWRAPPASGARPALLSRSPYAVVFVQHEGNVRIVAFSHAKRLPGHWRNRI